MPSLRDMVQGAHRPPKANTSQGSVKRKSGIFKSSERITESDQESETESESSHDSAEESKEAVQSAAKLNGRKDKVSSASGDESNGEPDEGDDVTVASSTSKSREPSSDEESESASGRSSSDHSSADDSAVVEAPELHKVLISPQQALRISKTTEPAQMLRKDPAAPYNPPAGFEKVSAQKDTELNATQSFSHSNMAGKQLWYITAPASVPISAIKQVPVQSTQPGKPGLSLNGKEYGLVQGRAEVKSYTHIMLPERKSSGYNLSGKIIDQTIHLQQIVQLPHLSSKTVREDSHSQVPDKAPVPAKKLVRQQPKGLKMRFRPIGFGNARTGTIGSSSSTSEVEANSDSDLEEASRDVSPEFRRPVGLNLYEQSDVSSGQEGSSISDEDVGEDRSTAAKINTPEKSTAKPDSSIEESDDEMNDVLETNLAPKVSHQPRPRSRKRKLSDLRDESPAKSPFAHPKTDNKLLKTSKIQLKPLVLEGSPSIKTNGTHSRAEPTPSSSPSPTLSPKKTRNLPPQVTLASPGSSKYLKPPKKMTPIPVPQKMLLSAAKFSVQPSSSTVEESVGAGKIATNATRAAIHSFTHTAEGSEKRINVVDSSLSGGKQKRSHYRKEKKA